MSYAESWMSLSPEAFDFTQIDIPFVQQPNTVKDPNPWTEEEDRMLTEVVGRSAPSSINWIQIASHFHQRSNKDCRKRWVYSLAPTIKKGPWDAREDTSLIDGVTLYGTKWTRVSRHVGSRQADQCSRRWHQILKPNINRGRWSLYEEEMLQHAVRAHGRRWIEIVERYFPDRTPVATRSKYDQITRRVIVPDVDLVPREQE